MVTAGPGSPAPGRAPAGPMGAACTGPIRIGPRSAAFARVRLLVAVVLAGILAGSMAGCAQPKADPRALREVETGLYGLLGGTLDAMQKADAPALRARREELIALRLRVQKLRVEPRQSGMRSSLLESLDELVDAVGAAARGSEEAGSAGDSTAAGRDQMHARTQKLEQSVSSFDLCRTHLEKAQVALQRFQVLRDSLGGPDSTR